MNTDEKIAHLRQWLRYNGDYHIEIDLWDLYGTVGLKLSHHATIIKAFRGNHFEKRLDEAILYCKHLDETKEVT